MATKIPDDISLGAALDALEGYDPCSESFHTYKTMDRSVPAYEVWHQADPEDLRWVVGVLDLFGSVPAYQVFCAARSAADSAKAAITGPAYDEWQRAEALASQITSVEDRRVARNRASSARGSICDAAYQAWQAAYNAAQDACDSALQGRDTYRIVLRHLKTLL